MEIFWRPVSCGNVHLFIQLLVGSLKTNWQHHLQQAQQCGANTLQIYRIQQSVSCHNSNTTTAVQKCWVKKNYNYAEIDVKCSQHTLEQLYECLRQLLPTSVHAVKLAKKLHSQLPDKYRTVLMLFSGAEKESNAVAKMCCIK